VKIVLEALETSDFPVIRDWMDPEVFPIFHHPVDDAQLERLLTKIEGGRPTDLGYRICAGDDREMVGLTHAILNWNNRLAHIGQIVIGDPARRGQGIGCEALRQLLRICFEEHRLHRAQVFVDEDNRPAIRCYQKAGFQIEGLMREARKSADRYISWHSMSILDREWRGG